MRSLLRVLFTQETSVSTMYDTMTISCCKCTVFPPLRAESGLARWFINYMTVSLDHTEHAFESSGSARRCVIDSNKPELIFLLVSSNFFQMGQVVLSKKKGHQMHDIIDRTMDIFVSSFRFR